MTPGEVLTVNGKEYRCAPKGTEYDYVGEAGYVIADPYEIMTWVCPEGGGGPRYDGM